MDLRRLLAAPAVALALVALPGCSDDDTDEPVPGAGAAAAGPAGSEAAQIKQAMDDYNRAFGEGDHGRMCELMTKSARDEFLTAAKRSGVDGDCAAALEESLEDVPDEQLEPVRKALAEAEVSDIEVDGDTGSAELTITVEGQSRSTRYPVAKENGGWKVQQNPGAAG